MFMKKELLFITVFLLTGLLSFGQTLVTEDFSSGSMPPSGWTIDAHSANWSVQTTQIAGGSSPEARFYYAPDFTGISRLISPSINTNGMTSLTLSFHQMLDDFAGEGYSIGVATRSAGGDWNTVWTVNPTGNIESELKVLELNTSDVGSDDFQFCIYFSGPAYNLDNWYIDDIKVVVSLERDAALSKINVPRYSDGINMQMAGKVLNMGYESLTSFTVNYQIDNEEVVSDMKSGYNMSLGEVTSFSFTNPLNLAPGNYNLKMWVSDANGTGPDMDASNDTLNLDLHIASLGVARRPLFEEFTSSTCNPCASFNSGTFNPFVATNGDAITLVKYQMSWPSPGDPYYTAEGGVRRQYYGVSFVPDLYVDGVQTATSSSGVNNAFNNSLDNAAFMDLSATHIIDGETVSVHLDINSYISGQVTAYIVIFENVTTGNVASNGETEFHHVMMKMLPVAQGAGVTLTDGVVTGLDASADMSTTNVEDMSDLGVAVFVQEPSSKMIFQSAYSNESTVGIGDQAGLQAVKLYPNPSDGMFRIKGLENPVDVHVYNMYGQEVKNISNFNGSTLNLQDLREGNYVLRMEGNGLNKTQTLTIIK